MLVVHSKSTDVYENLAAEDAMLDDATQTEPVVFVYRNDDAVVIGKNQNPWRECAIGKLDSLGVKLARRVSGGGTVFHDPGNLNISCILPRENYCRKDVLNTYVIGLGRAEVIAEVTGGSSLTVGGKKISGNAFCFRQNKVLHHGTILWQTDLDKLRNSLVPDLPDISTRAISSIPMPVINLQELLPNEKPDSITQAIIDALMEKFGAISDGEYNPFAQSGFAARVEKMKSWNWLYGTTPDFSVMRNGKLVEVHRGRIRGNSKGQYPELSDLPFGG